MMLIGKREGGKKTRKPTAMAVLAKSHSAPRANRYIAQTVPRCWNRGLIIDPSERLGMQESKKETN